MSGEVAVIGGGICGSTTAAVLGNAGFAVTVFDPTLVHQGHVAAALTPVISSDDNARSRLSRLGAILADQYWRNLQAESGVKFGLDCGALQLQRPAGAKRAQDLEAQVNAFGQPDWARWVDAREASELAGMDLPRGGIWYPGGWLIQVPKLVEVLQSRAGVSLRQTQVSRIEQNGLGWLIRDAQDNVIQQADVVVLANAFDVLGLLQRSQLTQQLSRCKRLPALHRMAGEVTLLPAQALQGGPRCVVGGDGYVLPAVDRWCVSGGTYVRATQTAHCTDVGRKANVVRAEQLLGLVPQIDDIASLPGWAGWRAVLPGRLPAIGRLEQTDNLWVFTAGASRGLTWSVLGAKLICEGVTGHQTNLTGSFDAQMGDSIQL